MGSNKRRLIVPPHVESVANSREVVSSIIAELGDERAILFLSGITVGLQFALDHRKFAKQFQKMMFELVKEVSPEQTEEEMLSAATRISDNMSSE